MITALGVYSLIFMAGNLIVAMFGKDVVYKPILFVIVLPVIAYIGLTLWH